MSQPAQIQRTGSLQEEAAAARTDAGRGDRLESKFEHQACYYEERDRADERQRLASFPAESRVLFIVHLSHGSESRVAGGRRLHALGSMIARRFWQVRRGYFLRGWLGNGLPMEHRRSNTGVPLPSHGPKPFHQGTIYRGSQATQLEGTAGSASERNPDD